MKGQSCNFEKEGGWWANLISCLILWICTRSICRVLKSSLDEPKVAWYKTLGAQTSQQLMLCVFLSISLTATINCLLHAMGL